MIGLVFSTAGFSVMDVNRRIEAGVDDDENAYLAVNQTTDTVTNDTKTEVTKYEKGYKSILRRSMRRMFDSPIATKSTSKRFRGPTRSEQAGRSP